MSSSVVTMVFGSSKKSPSIFPARSFSTVKKATATAPTARGGLARVPDALLEDTIESAEECPGECIMIEPYSEDAVF